MTPRGYSSSGRQVSDLGPPPKGPAPGARPTPGPTLSRPAGHLVESVDFGSGRPWSRTLLGRLEAWWRRRH